ncbi:nitroreductase [Pseudoalteromonas phenolica]|uniref:Nitroreductase n=1 Tax=Pseudoalteromonas phenolica TaxID=161398 RepID=A0A5S3YQ56_9GAMM|nr:nitroreductase family protein [Pseudoalteromonas phenolica]TMP78769.1 nitroreductase [Pseudoalteromonas phenolica]
MRVFFRPVLTLVGFIYDWFRVLNHGGWRKKHKNSDERVYILAKSYHSLEKSLSFKDNDPERGWANAHYVAKILTELWQSESSLNTAHELAAINAVQEFYKKNSTAKQSALFRIKYEWILNYKSQVNAGVKVLKKSDVDLGILKNPADFFLTRYSLRDFSSEVVPRALIEEATKYAMKSPSACNRQSWRVDVVQSKEKIDQLLSVQNGNQGFTHNIHTLAIISADLKAFISGNERYQHWIDGGLFSMSFIYSLHSLGVGSCCLNWSQMIKPDLALRGMYNLPDSNSVIMMLAIGYPKEENIVCVSPRRDIEEVLHFIEH